MYASIYKLYSREYSFYKLHNNFLNYPKHLIVSPWLNDWLFLTINTLNDNIYL